MDPVKVGAVGLGRWANVLAAAYTTSDKVKLVSCFTRSGEKRREFAERYHCEEDRSLSDLLGRDDIEAVIVTVPNDNHAEVIEQALRAGKHVYVEKPIAVDLYDINRIRRAVDQAGVRFMVGHSARRLGGLRKIRDMMASGEMGQVSMVEAVFSNERGLELEPSNWRGNPEKSPGGPLTQLGVHQIDNMQFLMGPIARVSTFGKPMYTKVANDTVLQTIVEFESGTMGYLGTNWACPGSFTLNLYGTEGNAFYELDFGWWSKSAVTDDHSSLRFVRFESRGDDPDNRPLESRMLSFSHTNHLRDEVDEFVMAVRNRAAIEVGLDEGVRNMAVVLAAARSARDMRVVEVDEVIEHLSQLQ